MSVRRENDRVRREASNLPEAAREHDSAAPPATLSVLAVAETLLHTEWSERWRLLRAHEWLTSRSIANWCEAQGDRVLASVINRASEIGLEHAKSEWELVRTAIDLVRDWQGQAQELSELQLNETVRATQVLASNECGAWAATWILSAAVKVRERLAEADLPVMRDACRSALKRLLRASDAEIASAQSVMQAGDYGAMWDHIRASDDLDATWRAAQVVDNLTTIFEPDSPLASSGAEFLGLLRAARERGPLAAAQEQQMILAAHAWTKHAANYRDIESAIACGQSAHDLLMYFSQFGGEWIIAAALEPSEQAAAIVPTGLPERASVLSLRSVVIRAAVESGVLPATEWHAVVAIGREAVECATVEHLDHVANLANLSHTLAMAIRANALPESMLTEAIEMLTEAVGKAPESHPDRASLEADLGALYIDALVSCER